MLYLKIKDFIEYCQVANFSNRSIETLTTRLNEFQRFLSPLPIENVSEISYEHLLDYVADFGSPSIHIKKSRVWALHQFFHFMGLNGLIEKNIALLIPYPKIERTVPQFLTQEEYNRILSYFYHKTDSLLGLRNLLIIMLLGFLGLRLRCLISLNIEDVDLVEESIRIKEKGGRKSALFFPEIISPFLNHYLTSLGKKKGPLFLSKRGKRISERTLQDMFHDAVDDLGIKKHLHTHLFRHTAATLLNKVSGIEITQHVLGHSQRFNTLKYAHLNPDQYVEYMRRHPYMNI